MPCFFEWELTQLNFARNIFCKRHILCCCIQPHKKPFENSIYLEINSIQKKFHPWIMGNITNKIIANVIFQKIVQKRFCTMCISQGIKMIRSQSSMPNIKFDVFVKPRKLQRPVCYILILQYNIDCDLYIYIIHIHYYKPCFGLKTN